ncbi:MAG: hypothetical protein LH647_11730 [Leptolyngbyaceae cyanobacterium CAN_BIN12]|nr:hypothetical protein [Leptolyngbyaceae cyanobacterium CAN_BIN12]
MYSQPENSGTPSVDGLKHTISLFRGTEKFQKVEGLRQIWGFFEVISWRCSGRDRGGLRAVETSGVPVLEIV